MGVGGQSHAPAVLHPEKRRGVHCTRDWCSPWLIGRVVDISPPSEFDPRAVQLSYSCAWPPRREVQLQAFLNLVPDGIERSSSCSAAFPRGTDPLNRLRKGLGGPERWFARRGEGNKKWYCDCCVVQIVAESLHQRRYPHLF